jgi:hypothetical protein
MENIITQFIRECNTWNTYVIHVLFDASGRYSVVGRTGLGAVLSLFLLVSDVLYTSRMVWYRGVNVVIIFFGYKVFVMVVTMYE